MPRHFHKMMSPQFFHHGVRHKEDNDPILESKIEDFLKDSLMIFLMPIKSLMSKIRSYF